MSLEEYCQQALYEVRCLTIGSLDIATEGQEGDLLDFIPDADDLPLRRLERAELERLLAQAIDLMPKMERTVLSLYYHEEAATLREIARRLREWHISRIAQLKNPGHPAVADIYGTTLVGPAIGERRDVGDQSNGGSAWAVLGHTWGCCSIWNCR